MAAVADTRSAAGQPGTFSRNARVGAISLVIGLLLFSIPTMIFVVRQSWTGEEGAHGPIVLVTGLWLLFRRWKEVSGLARVAPSASVWALLACLVPLQIFARITQIVEIEGYLMYACLLVVLYSLVGLEVMKRLWFPDRKSTRLNSSH